MGVVTTVLIAGGTALAAPRGAYQGCGGLEMTAADAPNVLVGGVVALDGRPLTGARVQIAGTDRGTLVRADGTFELSGLDARQRIIEVRLLGHGTQWHEVAVSERDREPYCFVLREVPVRPLRFERPYGHR
jgi:hypothetical protein